MRALFFEFPGDGMCWELDDQFVLGDDLLVAPVTAAGQRSRRVYLPAGAGWRRADVGAVEPGGQWIEADSPLAHIPWFRRVTMEP
jgi:alpha-D-xyloside xylohydrolase